MSEKRKIGALLSRYLKEIGNEPGKDGKTIKVELLARKIWELALGEGPSCVSTTGKIIPNRPDKDMITLIFERVEGKVGSYDENIKRIEDIPDKVSKAAVSHINRMSVEKQVA